MVDQPLPNSDSDNSDSGSDSGSCIVDYVVRVTPCDKFTYEDFCKYIDDCGDICRYVISRETNPKEHFHLVMSVDEGIAFDDARAIIRSYVAEFWYVLGKLPRGFGNKQYNFQLANDIDKAISYAVKQGDFKYVGYDDEYIKSKKGESFTKPSVSDFKKDHAELCERFQTSDLSVGGYMKEFCLLKAKHGQLVNMQHAYQSALSNLFKREPDAVNSYVNNFLSRV